MADGTYMLTVDAASFKEKAKDATEEWALSTREAVDRVNSKDDRFDFTSEEYVKHL
jgi:hypothetical protein